MRDALVSYKGGTMFRQYEMRLLKHLYVFIFQWCKTKKSKKDNVDPLLSIYSQLNETAMSNIGMAAKKNCSMGPKTKSAYRSWGLTVLRRFSFVLLIAASSIA